MPARKKTVRKATKKKLTKKRVARKQVHVLRLFDVPGLDEGADRGDLGREAGAPVVERHA